MGDVVFLVLLVVVLWYVGLSFVGKLDAKARKAAPFVSKKQLKQISVSRAYRKTTLFPFYAVSWTAKGLFDPHKRKTVLLAWGIFLGSFVVWCIAMELR